MKELDLLNNQINSCTRCPLSNSRLHALPGEGNTRARFFLVALSPGEQEDKAGKMFIGPSGKVLDQLLAQADINRADLYISNLIKCNLPQNRKPKMREIQACHPYLDAELKLINPEFIITLGFYASRYILQKFHADPPPAKIDYRPLYGSLFYADAQKILLLPHPASLLYKPQFWPQTQTKYNLLKTLSSPCKWYFCCPMKKLYELNKIPRKWIELFCHGNWTSCQRYIMEENGQYHPDNMLPDGSLINL